ncbi:hypothetical protein [Brevundimonas sp. FT23042]|uniref:hypothetical protein n=1 Tax=Brevundimonas sp. FT23042 TaxID=3393749 RepID=UPI003B586EC7
MIEESFVRLYAHDFVQMARKSELGQDVDAMLQRRLTEARRHADLMDARKGPGHLAVLASRIRDEAQRFDGRTMLHGADPRHAAQRHLRFLSGVADSLGTPSGTPSSALPEPSKRRRGRAMESISLPKAGGVHAD